MIKYIDFSNDHAWLHYAGASVSILNLLDLFTLSDQSFHRMYRNDANRVIQELRPI